MRIHKASRALIFGALLVALAACQPIAANPTPDPATLGFEALPPPTEEASIVSATVGGSPGTLLYFTNGEDCYWAGSEPIMVGDEPTTYYCHDWTVESTTLVALGPLASVQGLSFQAQRVVAEPVDGRLQVVSTAPFPFNVLQVVLEDGTLCTNLGEGTNWIVEDTRISFICNDPAFGTPPGGEGTRLVLLNGLHLGEDGHFTVEGGFLAGDDGSEALSEGTRFPLSDIVAQPLIVSVTSEENGKTIYLSPAQILEVTLSSNVTTGHSWTLSEAYSAPLKQAAEPEYLAPPEPMPGAGGAEVLRFDVAGVGSGELLLEYRRPFASDEAPAETFRLNVIVAVTLAENNSRVTLPLGDTLAVDLPGNPSTGFQWQVVGNDGQILAQSSDPVTISSFVRPNKGGVQRFTFTGVAPGSMTLTLVHVRPWEPEGEPANTFTLDVTVE